MGHGGRDPVIGALKGDHHHMPEKTKFTENPTLYTGAMLGEFWQSEETIPLLTRRVLKGIALGTVFGITKTLWKPTSPFAMRLLNEYAKNNVTDNLRMFGSLVRPYMIGGAFIGVAHYGLHDRIVPHFATTEQSRYIWSHALTGSLICCMFFNPIFVFRSAFFGSVIGNTRYNIYREPTPKTGFYITQGHLSDADYVNMRNEDEIHSVGFELNDLVTKNSWKSL